MGCAECTITWLDLETTIAYDEAEQEEEVPSSTPLSLSVGPLSAPEESRDLLDNSISKPEYVTPPSCQSLDASILGEGHNPSTTIGEGDKQESGPPSSQPFVSSFADTKVKEATDLFLGEGNWDWTNCLKKWSMSIPRSPRFHREVPRFHREVPKLKWIKRGHNHLKLRKGKVLLQKQFRGLEEEEKYLLICRMI